MKEKNSIPYAGFLTRLIIFVVDIALLGLVVGFLEKTPLPYQLKYWTGLIIIWLYYAIVISKWRTTISGKLFGIEIVRADDQENLNFAATSIRFVVSFAPFVLYSYIRGMQHAMELPTSATLAQLPQLIYILLPLVMLFTAKKQMIHDMIARSIVIDTNAQRTATSRKATSLLKTILILLFLVSVAYMVLYVSVFYKLARGKERAYDASFRMHYTTKDFNDTRIRFYQKELERYSKEFIEANGMYDIFAADTKKDLALNCIEAALKDHNVSDWIEMGSGFRKNARNKFANTKEMIKKAKANEDWMGHHFYDYDTNDVNHIEKKIANIWDPKVNKNTCDKLMPAAKMYDRFIQMYIPNREEALGRYRDEYSMAKPSGTLNKSFYKKEIEKTKAWIEELYNHYPALKLQKQKEDERIERENQETLRRAKKREEEERRKKREAYEKSKKECALVAAIEFHYPNDVKKLLEEGSDPNCYDSIGITPLFAAITNKDISTITLLLEHGADIHKMDAHNGYNALSWAAGGSGNDEDKSIEIVKLFLRHGANVNYQHNGSETALTVAAKGCKNFEMVKLLLDHGADPTLMDEFGTNTIKGLHRYCREGEDYQKMLKLIKSNGSFFSSLF